MLKKYWIFYVAAFVVLIFAAGGAYYYYSHYAVSKNPEEAARKDVEQLVAEVGKHMVLPEGEVPTVATVSDPAKLAGQDFFINAKVGDRVLLYPFAKKAILYDPVSKKILEVSTLFVPEESSETSLDLSE